MDIKLPKILFPFIWHCLKEYKHAVIIYVFLSLAAGLWGPFNSLLIKSLINLLPRVEHEDISILTLPSILIVINFIVFDNFTWRGLAYINYRFLPFLLNKIDSILLEYTLQHSYQFFQERMAGSLAKQMFNLIDGIEKIILSSARNIIKAVSLLLMAFAFAYSVSPIFFASCFYGVFCFFLLVYTCLESSSFYQRIYLLKDLF
jgi:ATP-binding cassette subfamily B protein